MHHDRTKYIEVDLHFIKETLNMKLIDLPIVRSSEQLVDVLTLAYSTELFCKSLNKLSLEDICAPT